MKKIWKIEDVAPAISNGNKVIELTNEEKQSLVDKWNERENKSGERKLKKIKEYRQEKLVETDWWVLRGNMTTEQSNYRQKLRDIPQDYTTEEEYDLLLVRDEQGNLTHTVWSKP